MKEPKVALAMIVGAKEDPKLLQNCLDSVTDHVDGVFINFNAPSGKKVPKKLLDVAKGHSFIETEWTGDFVGARKKSFDMVTDNYDWILWLDVDDTVENPEKIKEVCAIVSPSVDGIYINYDYAHDEYGNTTVSHYNARVVRNNGSFAWKSSFSDSDVTVHETLNETRRVGKVMNNEWQVIHHSDPERMDSSLRRNIKILEGMLENSKDSVDPRILFYLATHYVDAGFYPRAKMLFEKYLTMSGWAEERSQAWVYLGDIYKRSGDTKKARGAYMHALAENPKDAAPYVELGELDMQDKLWEKSIEWLEMAVNKKQDLTAAIQRPMEATYRAYKLLSEAYVNTGPKGYKNASKWLKKAIEMRPYDEELQAGRDVIEELKKVTRLNKSIINLSQELKEESEDRVLPFLDALPYELQTSPLVHQLRNYHSEPKEWPKKSIAIFAGGSAVGTWGPWSIEEGIGGSEEAIIQLSKIFSSKGWDVTVYAIPGTRAGVHDGVTWKHYWEANLKDEFDVFIGWRDPALFDNEIKARKKYLWLHDVIDSGEITDKRLDNLDKVIFVGQYHRDLYDLPDDKCFVSGNGIDPDQFDSDGEYERDPHRCVYQSAHERGLELLYRIWPDVRKEVPDATLDVYYGWTGFDEVNKDNPERMAWKAKLLKTQDSLKDLGVTNHGKIGHKQVVEEIYKSGVWSYPTPFPEVYCITGVKMQAGGAWPVTSDYAALAETVKFGDKTPMPKYDKVTRSGMWDEEDLEKYKKSLIHRLKNPPSEEERREMMDWARKNMSWQATAESWEEEFGGTK